MSRYSSASKFVKDAIKVAERGASPRTARNLQRTGRGALATSKYLSHPAFILPVVGLAGVAGWSNGFANEIINSPTGQDFLQLYAPRETQNPTAMPLGYYATENPYMYSTPPDGGMGATGELALALFKTRHGR